MKSRIVFVSIVLAVLLGSLAHAEETTVRRTLQLHPKKGNPRNSEGDFIQLRDGRLLFVYTHFTGGTGDHSTAHLAGRYSKDGGLSWATEDVPVVPNEGKQNVMSVSLLRLNNGEIALFYLVKNSLKDCRPNMRISKDEARTWSKAKPCITDEIGYYVLNNDRVIQLSGGRLVMPVALHNKPEWKMPDWKGTVLCYLSDDNGASWRRSKDARKGFNEKSKRVIVQEPGVIELKDGRLLMFCRTDAGSQYLSCSRDKGESWTPLRPSSISSPISPASMERIPATGHLLIVWNNHRDIDAGLKGKRTPLCTAISRDDGRTWKNERVLEGNPHGWYCYTAIHFTGEHVLLGYCAGDRRKNNGLATTQVTRVSLKWLYSDSAAGTVKDSPKSEFVYKTVGKRELKIYLDYPAGWKASDRRGVIVFFFGGGWTGGSVKQFEVQAAYFATRGLVAGRADYRVKSRDGVTPDKCVEDARSAVRWIRKNAGKLGIDPAKLVASGGSAGGHLAACMMIAKSVDDPKDDLKISTVPAAMVLFNPVLNMSHERIIGRLGDAKPLAGKISPIEHLDKKTPPALILFGTNDGLKVHGEEYWAKAKKLGVRADEYLAQGQGHGFFNRSPWRERTLVAADKFLASLGLLKGEPTVKLPTSQPGAPSRRRAGDGRDAGELMASWMAMDADKDGKVTESEATGKLDAIAKRLLGRRRGAVKRQ